MPTVTYLGLLLLSLCLCFNNTLPASGKSSPVASTIQDSKYNEFANALPADGTDDERAAPLKAESVSAAQNPSDEASLRALAEAFYRAWAAKDLDGYLRLLSAGSPDFEASRKATREFFANGDQVELRGLTIRVVKIDGDRAGLSVGFDARSIEAKTGVAKSGYWKMRQTLECMKEAGDWKVWREVSAFAELAAALAALKSEEERAALLAKTRAEDKEVVTAELVHALNVQGARLQYPQSLAAAQLALSIGEQIGDRLGTARSMLNIGGIHHSRGDYARAAEYYRKSLAIWESLENKTYIAITLNSLGGLHQIQGDNAQALEYYRKSLAINEAVGNKAGTVQAMNNIGSVHFYQGDYAETLEYARKALALAEPQGDRPGIARSFYNIGLAQHSQGDYAQALEHLQKSLAIREALGAKAAIADTLFRIGNVHQSQGDYEQALERLQRCLALAESLEDKALTARTLFSMGNAHLSKSNYARALEYFYKSLALAKALGIKVTIANTLNSIGVAHRIQGDYAQALERHRESLALNELMGDKGGIANQMNNIGVIYHNQKENARALEYFRKSLQMWEALGARSGVASSLNNIGRVYHSQGDYEMALEFYQKSLALGEELGAKAIMARMLSNIEEVHEKLGRHSLAMETAERAAALAQQTGDIDTLRKTRWLAGVIHRALKEPAMARHALEEAIALTETLRVQVAGGEEAQQRFFAPRVAPYHAMVDLLAQEGQPAEALIFAERARARALLDALQTGRANVTRAMTGDEQEQERKLRAELISINTQVTSASQKEKQDQAKLDELKSLREKARLDYEAFQTALYAAHPELRAQRGESPVINADEIAALLPDATTALLEYVVTDETTYLFVGAKATGVRVYTLPIKRDELARQTESFRRQLSERDLGFRASAKRLYQLLLKPAQAELRDKTNLVIAPDDKLWELPFQALLAEDDRYVIERSAVSYAPSLTALREMRSRGEKRRTDAAPFTLLALGNPVIGRETIERAAAALRDGKLDPLPEAEQEVKALGRLYGGARSKIYVGAEATEDRVKAEAPRARVLHLATHGVLNDASPMYSYLALATGDKNEDGLLEAWEMMRLDLRADLVVLSACETARGRASAGEGIIGLTWAMFVAGAPATVVSQWKVESASARDLMLEFHKRLTATKTPKAEALRRAALRLLKGAETSHPFYWAGFTLVGDGE